MMNITSLTASDKATYSDSELDSDAFSVILITKRLVHLTHKVWSYLCFSYLLGLLHSCCHQNIFIKVCWNSPWVQFLAQGSLCRKHTWSYIALPCKQQSLHHCWFWHFPGHISKIGCKCFTRYSSIPTPDQYFCWSLAEIFSLLIIVLMIKN